MNTVLAFYVTVAAAFGAAMPPFPPEMEFLNQLPADDPDKVVDAVRQYVLLQTALAEWDSDIMQELGVPGGNIEDARARAESAKKRLGAIGQAYKVLLERYPRNARAQNYYGEYLYDYENDEAGAIRYWKEATMNDEKLALPYNNLGIHYSHTGQMAFGLDNYRKALELDPGNPDFKFNLAQTYLINTAEVAKHLKWDEAKVFKEAMKLSKEAAESKPTDYKLQEDYATNFYAAERYDVKLDWADAAAAWRRARTAAKNNEQVFFTWLNEARAWIRKPDKVKAEESLNQALLIVPGNAVATGLLEKVKSGAIGEAKAN
ncbi:MAG: hypothetical protein SGI88_02385 [Candidatus Hydrogenedentes bacterium]|nr:hypothetical protein [Candidatus Hydrogenedentota bacterium]